MLSKYITRNKLPWGSFTLWLYLQVCYNTCHIRKTDTKSAVTYKHQAPAVSITTHPHDTHDRHTG